MSQVAVLAREASAMVFAPKVRTFDWTLLAVLAPLVSIEVLAKLK